MTATPEKIVAASKANVEAGLKSASAFVTTVFTAAERVAWGDAPISTSGDP